MRQEQGEKYVLGSAEVHAVEAELCCLFSIHSGLNFKAKEGMCFNNSRLVV